MGKIMRVAVAVLYAVQVVVIFRESIAHLYDPGEEGPGAHEQKQTETVTADDPLTFFRRAFQPIFKRQGMLAAAPITGGMALAILPEIREEHRHEHPPEKKKDFLTKRGWRKRLKEYLIANLYPDIKNMAPPAAAAVALNPISTVRAPMFLPSND